MTDDPPAIWAERLAYREQDGTNPQRPPTEQADDAGQLSNLYGLYGATDQRDHAEDK